MLGAELLGVYQVALSVFIVLTTIVASGMPIIVSKLTANIMQTRKMSRKEV